jgi:hypothetical protein
VYLRFVYARTVEGLQSREGIFQAATSLAWDPETDAYSYERVQNLRNWFGNKLDVPERFSKSTSKGAADRDAKGLSWFKPTAKEHIAKAFELKAILEENGYAIEVLKESRIGYVTFEDEFQIVAEPFSDTLR